MPLFYPRAKERGQNNQPLLCRAEHGLHFDSAVCTPDVCGIRFTCQTTQPKMWLWPWSLFWPITKSGEKQEEHESPKGLSLTFPPQMQHDLSCRADRYFASATAFYCEIQMFWRYVSIFLTFVKNYHNFWFLEARTFWFLLIGFYSIVQWHISKEKIKLDFIKGNFLQNGNSWLRSALHRTEKESWFG